MIRKDSTFFITAPHSCHRLCLFNHHCCCKKEEGGFLPAPPSISFAPPKISKIPFDHLSEVT